MFFFFRLNENSISLIGIGKIMIDQIYTLVTTHPVIMASYPVYLLALYIGHRLLMRMDPVSMRKSSRD